ncbi:MAG: TauD/TfdA dioxygenase family protein [Pseudomonadales bacterium]
MNYTQFTVKPLDNVGVEICDFDINAPFGDTLEAELKHAWYEHAIMVFRDQSITPERQIEFSRLFGPLELHPLKIKTSETNPELFVLENGGEADAYQTAFFSGEEIVGRLDWHMDLHYTGKPNHGAVLRALTVADKDGLTGFGDLALAYDALSDDLKERIKDIEVAYRFEMQRINWRFVDNTNYQPGPNSPKKPSDIGFPDFDDSVYPAVVTHPISGRKVLEIVEQFLHRVIDPASVGLSANEADRLLQELVEHTRKPEFHYWHHWREGDMVLWDNWRAMHCTSGTPPGVKRLINRTTIEGDIQIGRQIPIPQA